MKKISIKNKFILSRILHRLKNIREKRDFRHEDISKKLNIARSTYLRKEHGSIPITTEEWLKLADAMDVEADYFFQHQIEE